MKYFFLFLLLVIFIPFSYAAPEATIYQNAACGHCITYLNEFKGLLSENGMLWQEKNIIDDKRALEELDQLTKSRNIPYELQGHMVITINDLVLEGHVPFPAIEELFEKYPDYNFPKIVLYQDSMDDLVTEYTIFDENRKISKCTTAKSIENCELKKDNNNFNDKPLLLLILFNGLLAGIHPCTITVLLFFIAFLFTIRKSRFGIFKIGLAYILGIFIAYFGIGIGVLKAITFTNSPHFAAKVGAALVLILGVINIISFFYKKDKFSFGLPKSVKPKLVELIQKVTIPAAFIVGLLVGICSFGCTAGIYLSIMSFLLIKSNYLQGVIYLLLYNLMFILPLVIILILASTKSVVTKIEKLEQSEKKYIKLIAGIVMIIVALILLWITYLPGGK